jgi:catechol 2,3-dioxygenase-like lactoylglutathione lyase family enzyme
VTPDQSTVRELRLVLTVEDFDEALALYRDALGLEEREAWEAHGGRIAILAAGAATLELVATIVAGPVVTPWRDQNVRLETRDRLQLTLFSEIDGEAPG